jgi:hypothetical protein
MSHESLGTKYCPNCAILQEKEYQLTQWEKNLEARELELDQEMEFIQKRKSR